MQTGKNTHTISVIEEGALFPLQNPYFIVLTIE